METELEDLNTIGECIDFAERARANNQEDLAMKSLKKAIGMQADGMSPRSEAEKSCYESIFAYEQVLSLKNGRKTRAGRTWPMVEREGILSAVEKIVNKPDDSAGYTSLMESDFFDYAFETAVLRYPDAFSDETLANAQKRLKGVSRKKFIEANGATCNNWTWSWSFVNHSDKVVIFGAWDKHTTASRALILKGEWRFNKNNKKVPGFGQSREHIRLIEDEDYSLKTFPIVYSEELQDEDGVGPAKIDHFVPVLSDKKLVQIGTDWWAVDEIEGFSLPEEVTDYAAYLEGASKRIHVNAYERNLEARKLCIAHYGCKCIVCGFDFYETFGDIGQDFIHVHHIKPLSEVQEEYQVDPVEDLVPVCPNCHAMIHRRSPAMSIEDLKKHLSIQNLYT